MIERYPLQKAAEAYDWTLDVLFAKDLVQFVTVRAPHISQAEERVSRQSNGGPLATNREERKPDPSVINFATAPKVR